MFLFFVFSFSVRLEGDPLIICGRFKFLNLKLLFIMNSNGKVRLVLPNEEANVPAVDLINRCLRPYRESYLRSLDLSSIRFKFDHQGEDEPLPWKLTIGGKAPDYFELGSFITFAEEHGVTKVAVEEAGPAGIHVESLVFYLFVKLWDPVFLADHPLVRQHFLDVSIRC